MIGLFAAFHEGGIFMYLILAISLFAFAMIILKSYQLWVKYRINGEEVTKSIAKQIEANNYARAIQYCNGKDHPLTNVLKAGLLRANKSEKEIRRAIEVAASDQISRFKRGLSFMPHFSNLSTMLGLTGTVSGLMTAFAGMEGGDAVKRQEALATGIAIAFRTTFFGLIVAAIIVFFYITLLTKQNKTLETMEHSAGTIIDMLITKNKNLLNAQKGN